MLGVRRYADEFGYFCVALYGLREGAAESSLYLDQEVSIFSAEAPLKIRFQLMPMDDKPIFSGNLGCR